MYRSYREYLRQQRFTKMKVLSIEQIHQLKELGVDVNTKGMCLMYTSDSSDNYYLKYGESTCEDDVVAFDAKVSPGWYCYKCRKKRDILDIKVAKKYGKV